MPQHSPLDPGTETSLDLPMLGDTPIRLTPTRAALLRVVLACADHGNLDDLTTRTGWDADQVDTVAVCAHNARVAHTDPDMVSDYARAFYIDLQHWRIAGALTILEAELTRVHQ